MNTVRVVPVTKSGNPLCDKSLAELALRTMPPTTETAKREALRPFDKVAS